MYLCIYLFFHLRIRLFITLNRMDMSSVFLMSQGLYIGNTHTLGIFGFGRLVFCCKRGGMVVSCEARAPLVRNEVVKVTPVGVYA